MRSDVEIRPYKIGDTDAIMELFYHTVHQVNCRDYTPEQIDAWAPANINREVWIQRLHRQFTFVVEKDRQIVGFGQLEATGHIDCFYCHKDFQGQGIGTKLLDRIECQAHSLGLSRLFAEVSITARLFFERKGFNAIRSQTVELRGQRFINFVMEKLI